MKLKLKISLILAVIIVSLTGCEQSVDSMMWYSKLYAKMDDVCKDSGGKFMYRQSTNLTSKIVTCKNGAKFEITYQEIEDYVSPDVEYYLKRFQEDNK